MEFSTTDTEYEGRFENRGFLSWLRFWQIRYEKVTLALVLGGKTKAPISLADFEAYMLYLANSIQDLQFIVWFHDYSARYFALPLKDQQQRCTAHLSTSSHDSLRPVSDATPDANSTPVAAQGDTGSRIDEKAAGGNPQGHSSGISQSFRSSRNLLRLATLPQPEITRPPCPPGCSCRLPFQDECFRVMQTFFRPNQNKVLDVDKGLVDEIASLLPQTTHPAVFAKVYAQVYSRVEEVHLHRFLTIASINVNRHDKVTIHMMGIGSLLVALAIAFSTILALPHKNPALRAWRTFAVPFFWFAVMLCYSAVRGVCPAKFQTKATALHPWELSDVENGGTPLVRIGCAPGTVCVVPSPTTVPPTAHTRSTPYGNHTPKSSSSSLSSTATPGGKSNDLSHSFIPSSSTGPSDKPAGGAQAIQSQWYDSAVEVANPPAPRPLPQYSDSDLGSGMRWEFGEWNSSRGNVRNGYRKNPVWGPHKIVRDRRIRAVQRSVVLESLGISILCTLVFSAALYAVPSLH